MRKLLKHFAFSAIFVCLLNGQGQHKAVFIHGFGSSNDSWLEKNTPADLINPPDGQQSVIDSYILFGYDLEDPEYENMAADDIFSDIVTGLNQAILQNTGPGDEWILVGHSLGGLIARAAQPYLSGFDIKGILTVGSPHQGAPAADVTLNDASSILDTLTADLSAGPSAGESEVALLQALLSDWGALLAGTAIPEFIPVAKAEGDKWIGKALGPPAASDFIGLEGSLIDQINGIPEMQEPHRSIIGSERSPTIIRWISEFSDLNSQSYDELELLGFFDDVQNWYSMNEHGWWLVERSHQIWCIVICSPFDPDNCWYNGECSYMFEARAKKKAWQRGVAAWSNMDATWAGAIGGGQWYGEDIRIIHDGYWDCVGPMEQVPPVILRAIQDGSFSFEEDLNTPEEFWPNEDICDWVDQTWTEIRSVAIWIPTKNDGLIQPKYERWNTSDHWDPEDTESMRQEGNYYYGDDPAQFEDGGWNHSEMMRYTRIYDGEDTGTPAAQVETPLKANAGWISTMFEE